MLWKKESRKDNALYVDFLANFIDDDFDFDEDTYTRTMTQMPAFLRQMIYHPPTDKSEEMAVRTREFGNSTFANDDWEKSIDWYNESLCSAPERSKSVALAYANRSACFLKMKMYAECLADIELAKGAGYPTEKMPKLDQRKINCLKEMEDYKQQQQELQQQQPNQFVEQLSYEPNGNFPSMANVLTVTKDDTGKYSVIANQDIDVGKTVVVEKALFGCPHPKHNLKCSICLKTNTNLIPCKKCTKAMFCSTECQSSGVHKYECGVKFAHNMFGSRTMGFLRSVLVAINLFSSADELMEFIEQTRKSSDVVPATMKDVKSQYHAYIKQNLCADDFKAEEMASCIMPIYKKLMGIQSIKQMFRAKKHERFLQHLIGNHSLISQETGRKTDEREAYVMMKYFNQSCAPNMITIPSNGRLLFITSRPIKKGEELFDATESRKRDCCFNKHRVKCECKLCKRTVKKPAPKELRKIAADTNFKDIVDIGEPSKWKKYDEKKLQTTINKCVSFLTEYGQVEWCDPIDKVMHLYRDFVLMGFEKRVP